MSELVSPAIRGAMAFFTYGASELLQAKPGNLLQKKQSPLSAFAGRLGDVFSPPEMTPPTAAPAPAPDTTAVQQRAATQARQRALAQGYRSTILSSQFMPGTPNTLKPTLGS